jgi:3-deoxy-manno-octulosonate cytidylyltransferase (CMP-KDO synthetase)
MMPVLGVVPARLASTRLHRTPLQPLAGVPLVVRVAERVRGIGVLDEIVIATEAEEVAEVVRAAGFRAELTSARHLTGTERVAEVATRSAYARFDTVVNIQGDEPFLPASALAGALDRLGMGDDVGTAASPLAADCAHDPGRVKVVMDLRGRALYFSRAAIPFPRDGEASPVPQYWQHLGIYACRRETLLRWVAHAPTDLEEVERLEQLRALQVGLTIGVARLGSATLPGVDTPDDLERAEAHWHATREDSA